MGDNLATLRAIDDAFTEQVSFLFKELCLGYGDSREGPPPPGCPAEKVLLKRFDEGLGIARQARDAVRKRFVDP